MARNRQQLCWLAMAMMVMFAITLAGAAAPRQQEPTRQALSLESNDPETVAVRNTGCMSCHTQTDSASMHPTNTVHIACVDCHGGNGEIKVADGAKADSREYQDAKNKAHVLPSKLKMEGGAVPPRVYAGWLKESAEYVRFVNPGDLRVADQTCGSSGCHVNEVRKVRLSMMTHGAMLWEAALYNNGGYPYKDAHYGESYGRDGKPQRIQTWPPPTEEETLNKGILPYLEPLQRWETSEPGNVLRVFERGGEAKPELGIENKEEDAGRPDVKLGNRGFGTQLRTDPVFLGLQKTRLLDPMLSFPGTNDQPGDYRHSGCTACHVIYANDRSEEHSAWAAKFGHGGLSASVDPTIPKNAPGHPIKHVLTKAIPSSQCIVCHIHPGTNMVATYFGYTWWDNEVDGKFMYPKQEHDPSEKEMQAIRQRNPESSSLRGLWGNEKFLEQVGSPEFNAKLDKTQFADFHSHGWIFRAVFKHDRKGNLLDKDDKLVANDDPDKFKKAVHLKDIHLEKGMQCVDCHFEQDSHGNGKLYGETRNAIEITCVNCHGDIDGYAKLITTGPAAPPGGTNLARLRTSDGRLRFYWKEGRLYQRSVVEPNMEWEVIQTKDTVTPGNVHYSEKSRYAKTVLKDGQTWGASPDDKTKLAHSDSKMTCASCHSSWTTTCFGCHLSMVANRRMPMLHNEGTMTRNWTSYNFHVLRDDAYMLGIDGTVTGNKVSPVRSACAIVVSSQNANRDWLYYGQQTVSAEGFSGQAFSTYVPHTVRSKETKQCSDCHVSKSNDNNAWMSQVLLFGTGYLNYMSRWAWVATGNKGFETIGIAERDEPPAIYGSELHEIAYPARYKKFEEDKRELHESYEHTGKEVLDLQLRGEYLYAAMGAGGFRIFDVANIDNKDFSERMTTAPVSPLGQRFYVKTKYATSVTTPTTLGVDPTRIRFKQNQEQPIHLITGFLYVTDKYEGLVVVGNSDPKNPGVATLLDGEPRNNFIRRAYTFNPDGILTGARRMAFAGVYGYVLADKGLVVIDFNDVLHPKVVATIPAPDINNPTGISIQFRYAFITDRDGLKVVDITEKDKPVLLRNATVPLPDARNVYTARTYAYVSGGKQGMVIVDIEHPDQPKLDQVFNANGELNDTNDIKITMVNSSQFAFVADGKNGFKIVQTLSPETVPGFIGFSPRPSPKLIARAHTRGPAFAVSRGVDRDRAVDESGNQLAVFGRRGARPFNKEELERMYLHDGQLYTVSDEPTTRATGPSPSHGEVSAGKK
ncbi:MAG TPA: hypothetical protein VFP40_16300 [Terriglobales bacterium]|nr:hypothetical protein [Terriglobales bacterium]